MVFAKELVVTTETESVHWQSSRTKSIRLWVLSKLYSRKLKHVKQVMFLSFLSFPYRVLFWAPLFPPSSLFLVFVYLFFVWVFFGAKRTASPSHRCSPLFWWSGVGLHPLTDTSLVGLSDHRKKHEHSQAQWDQSAQQNKQVWDRSPQDQPQHRWDCHQVSCHYGLLVETCGAGTNFTSSLQPFLWGLWLWQHITQCTHFISTGCQPYFVLCLVPGRHMSQLSL